MGATGTLSVHLIPSLNFGIGAFGDQLETKVFVNLDASVSTTLGVTAREKTKRLPRDEQIPARFARKGSPPIPDNSKSGSWLPSSLVLSRKEPANEASLVARADLPPASINGCFEADTGLSVNVGAEKDFFDLFSARSQIPLFNQSFKLFKVLNQLP